MRTETAKRLLDARSASREIMEFIEGRSLDDYLTDRKLQLPVERLLESSERHSILPCTRKWISLTRFQTSGDSSI